MARFNTDASVISVTKDEFAAIVAKMKNNRDGVPTRKNPSKSQRINDVLKVKQHHFVPRDYTRRLFIEHIDNAFEPGCTCIACSENITDYYAVSLRCPKTMMHPKCAAVVLSAVKPSAYHRCLTPLCTCNADGSLRESAVSCRHTNFGPTYMKDVYDDALALAMTG